MKLTTGLSVQLIITMALVLFAVRILSMLGTLGFYTVMSEWAPQYISSTGAGPSWVEWLWLVSFTFIMMGLSAFVAFKFAQRILLPVNAVAGNLRKIAQGDLSARVCMNKPPVGETAILVSDFNIMAQRLDTMARERAFWNAAIAHELRTPVTILRGRIQGLAEGVFEPSEKLFQNLLMQVENLSYLIEDLRVVGLVENGQLRLNKEPVILSAEVESVVNAFRNNLTKAGFAVALFLESGTVHCDVVRIRQALMALLDNALKYADSGPLHITLQIKPDICSLDVEDCGPGLPKEFASSVFNAFEQPHHPSNSGEKGSGLGLAVVKAIAVAHGGQAFCVPSALGGSVFRLSWPV